MVCRRCLYVCLPLAIRFGGLRYPWALAAGSTLLSAFTPLHCMGWVLFRIFAKPLFWRLLLCSCTTATFIYKVLLYFMLNCVIFVCLQKKKKRRNMFVSYKPSMVRAILRPGNCHPVYYCIVWRTTYPECWQTVQNDKSLLGGTCSPLFYCFFQATSIIVDIYCKWILHSCTHVICHFGRAGCLRKWCMHCALASLVILEKCLVSGMHSLILN